MTIVLCLLMFAAGCRGNGSEDAAHGIADTTGLTDLPEREDTVDTATTTEPPPEDAAVRDSSDWSTTPVRVRRSVSYIAVVSELRAGEHDRYDRLVVEFEGEEVPAFTVRYLEEGPIECGSGHAVQVSGEAVLEIHLDPARGHTEQGEATVDHAERLLEWTSIREVEISCDFEAVFTLVLGVAERRPFRVAEHSAPARLVVDVRHEDG